MVHAVISPASLPDYHRINKVASFEELVGTPFENGVNALCWPRALPGDFREIAEKMDAKEGITPLSDEVLNRLSLSPAGALAREILLTDKRVLAERGLTPELNCILRYPREEDPSPVPIDVYSFHADSAPIEADTYLCTYYGAPSEALRNEDAQRKIDIPEIRAALLKRFGGKDDDAFAEYLNENCYDLHYAPIGPARPFSFGLHHLWRIALDYPGNPVPPCVHRAPENRPGDPPRLMLIS